MLPSIRDSEKAMATQGRRTGNRLTTRTEQGPVVNKFPARRFPIQGEIQKLEDELDAFNERIAELKAEGHRSVAMNVLKAKALDFARQIDELRSLLVAPTKKGGPS
jgi:hypothetical protein